ncbi:saccharopine dehydrogenase [Arenicella chitinivorans]|uniref:Saccharopine dehydrogenase n=1 Tax=Arenicella chitinivorans TaxID=1329800 RepID=A0A918VL62_9GAMM|nr:saccharopine dehydrogenase NADP-binding domain-containing protein [Arenicella chitinivorans]GHA05371.1 saccharopine dehydrogenase [Arenicella chitinivorans]
MATRTYDVVVWGATGFTGQWVAKHLFDRYSKKQLRWAIAGRNEEKLRQVRHFIGDAKESVDLLIADSADQASLTAMAEVTKVIISTVGPYSDYGSLLVKVCAMVGTDYVDLAGEVPWMRDMIDEYSEYASKSGARIVHSCGFDSIPSDMGTFYIQQHAQQHFAESLKCVRYTLIKAKGGMSGGTIASMMNVIKLAVNNRKVRRLLGNPYALNPDLKFNGGDKRDQTGVRFSPDVQRWTAPFLMAGINTRIVRRSNALLGFRYGTDFRYSESMATGAGTKGYLAAKSISLGLKAMTLTSVTRLGRSVLRRFLPAQGEGPEVNPDSPGFYVIQFNGETRGGESVVMRLKGDSDPGYGSTSKMLAESAVCLAHDSISVDGGFWTPASAMGDALLTRLQDNAGLSFSVITDND